MNNSKPNQEAPIIAEIRANTNPTDGFEPPQRIAKPDVSANVETETEGTAEFIGQFREDTGGGKRD